MSTVTDAQPPAPRSPQNVPLRRVLGQARRVGPLGLLDGLGDQAQGEIVRLSLGPFKPFLVTHPDHLHHILRGNPGNFPRGAAMWAALGRLTGNGIGGEGAQWHASREILQSAFSASYLRSMGDQMISSITAAAADLAGRAGPERPVDAGVEMTRIVQRVVDPVFFGDLIPDGEGDRLGAAIGTAMGSLLWRMAMPFVPHAVPLPGDRAFKRATRTVNEILRPVLAEARQERGDGRDIVTKLIQGVSAEGVPLTDEQITEDIVALFVAGSESSAIALTWIWVGLAENPDVLARVRAEVDQVVGAGELRREHVRELTYTQMVLREVLRLHSVGWAVPRVAQADDIVGGVPIPAGSTLVISPYLTHRLESVWEDPQRFDPERFTRDRVRARHPLAYLPFGDGAHQCLGEAFFYQEAALIVAALLGRFDVALHEPVEPKLSLTLQPREPVQLILTPRR